MFMQRNVAYLLLIVMLGLIALGLVMLSSTSAVLAPLDMTGVYSNLRKQCVWLGLGGIVCVILSRYDYQKLLRHAPWAIGIACIMLILCLIPHVGLRINGSPRWLRLAGWTYQPSEFAKLALILFLSWWMGKNQRRAGEFLKGFFWPILCTAPIFFLMVKQEDFGTTAILLAILVVILFCSGTKMLYLLPVPVFGLLGIVVISLFNPQRMARWMAFLHPDQFRDGAGYQQWQGLIALGSGGLSGLGLGNSCQKMYYLPEVNTDFVFPIIGEELRMDRCSCAGPRRHSFGHRNHGDDRASGVDEPRRSDLAHALQGDPASFYQLRRLEFADLPGCGWYSFQHASAGYLPGTNRSGNEAEVV